MQEFRIDTENELTDLSEWTLDKNERLGTIIRICDINGIELCNIKYVITNMWECQLAWNLHREIWKKYPKVSKHTGLLDASSRIYTGYLTQCMHYCQQDWDTIKLLINKDGEINEN